MASLVDYLGLISTSPPNPAAGDMVRRSNAGGWETFNPGSEGSALVINNGVPTWSFGLSSTINVNGAFDGVELLNNLGNPDATIVAGTLNKVTASLIGPWAVGKRIVVRGAGLSGLGFSSTILSVSGTTATMADFASTPVTNATAVVGTDDTAAWLDAISQLPTSGGVGRTMSARDGISLVGAWLQLPANCNFVGVGKSATILQLFAAAAGVGYGPQFTHTGAGPLGYGYNGGWMIDGGLIATNPLFLNTNGATFKDFGTRFGNGDGAIYGGQNCVFIALDSGGHVGSNVVLDNGCGGGVFLKPELNFAGRYHIEVRSSQTAEGVGYGTPQYNYFEKGICEGRNSLISGSPGLGCVRLAAGRFNQFNNMNFFTDGFSGPRSSLVVVEGAATGNLNPDTGYNINGDHRFRDCTWTTGGGLGYGIEADNVDGGGVAQPFLSVIYPYVLLGESVFSGLAAAERIGTNTRPLIEGNVVYA